jgi:Winged helix domain, variant/ATPase family associated with various cellular activities (AAA)
VSAPYSSDADHLWDELARVEHLVRARVEVWSLRLREAGKPTDQWGMVHISAAEVAAFLDRGFTPPPRLAVADATFVAPHLAAHDDAARAIAERREAGEDEPGRLRRLAAAFALEQVDVDLLLLTVLPEVDPRYRLVYGYLQDDARRTTPTVDVLADVLAVVRDRATVPVRLAAGAPLRRGHLLRVTEDGPTEPPGRRRVAVDERVVRHLLGDDTAPDDLAGRVRALPAGDWAGYVAADARVEQLRALGRWCAEQTYDDGAVVLLHGPPGSGRTTTAAALATEAGVPLLAVDVDPTSPGWSRVVDLVHREARLRGAAVLWRGADALLDDGEPSRAWVDLLGRTVPGLLTLLSAEHGVDPANRTVGPPFLRLPLPAPDHETREALWRRHLPDAAEFAPPAPDAATLARTLAGAFQLTPGQVVDAVATARAAALVRDPDGGLLCAGDLAEGCRLQSGRRLTRLAQRVEPRPGLDIDDLVLPRPHRRQLDELRARIGARGRLAETGLGRRVPSAHGLLVMFTGSSGTGKTMAAELLAHEQGVDLYKIDLAEVVSKYVGETEKNLRQVFLEAEDANAIIFFDEADALFGKRGDVREARDRWANIEVNFLLQRVEQFDGIVVLATNLRQNIDEAFLRRIHVVVDFPFPDADARLGIWQRLLAAQRLDRPSDDELAALAERFSIPGGSIRNVVVDAAFRALDADPPEITLRHLAVAVAREYQKLGKPLTPVEFGGSLYGWVETDVLCREPAEG